MKLERLSADVLKDQCLTNIIKGIETEKCIVKVLNNLKRSTNVKEMKDIYDAYLEDSLTESEVYNIIVNCHKDGMSENETYEFLDAYNKFYKDELASLIIWEVFNEEN